MREARRSIDPWQQHADAIRALRASYAAIPAGSPVRLAKSTSNLFRPRTAVGAGLDVSGLAGVLEVDPVSRTALVQGMCTYEDLVDATLAHGLVPTVVPQLRTITLGGAVTGLGIESTSFRHGLPHEAVLEMDVLTGAGDVVTVRPGDDLFDAFPNSYGSLGYATRLVVELLPAPGHVELEHVRIDDRGLLAKTVAAIVETGEHDGERVDGLDGVVFAPAPGACTAPGCGGPGRAAGGAATSTTGWSASTPAGAWWTGSTVAPGVPGVSASSRTSRSRSSGSQSSSTGSTTTWA